MLVLHQVNIKLFEIVYSFAIHSIIIDAFILSWLGNLSKTTNKQTIAQLIIKILIHD